MVSRARGYLPYILSVDLINVRKFSFATTSRRGRFGDRKKFQRSLSICAEKYVDMCINICIIER